MFVAARMQDEERDADINSKYIVEEVDLRAPTRDLSQSLIDELHALAGKPLDSEAADRLEQRLKDALPSYEVSRRMARGSQPGHVRLIFDARRGMGALAALRAGWTAMPCTTPIRDGARCCRSRSAYATSASCRSSRGTTPMT